MFTSTEATTYSNTHFFNLTSDWLVAKKNHLNIENAFTCPSFGNTSETVATGEIKFKFYFQDSLKKIFGPSYDSCSSDKDEFSSVLNDRDQSFDESDSFYSQSDSIQESSYTSCQNDKKTEEKTLNSSACSDSPKGAFTSVFEHVNYSTEILMADLNQWVDFILDSTPIGIEDDQVKPIAVNSQGSKKRMRKSIYQMKILNKEYKLNNNWDKEQMNYISNLTGLSHYQVYKWFWEQKKKNKK